LRLLRGWPASPRLLDVERLRPASGWPRVEIVQNHAGADGAIVRALVASGVDGLVVAGTGNGTLHHSLQAALLQAQDQGTPVRRTTRCAEGVVLAAPGDRLPHVALSPVKARIALMLELLA
jgi:L-asparaginase